MQRFNSLGYALTFLLFFMVLGCNDDNDVVDNTNVWSGAKITFTKADLADWTLEQNQDRITANVWITRANTKGIFNIISETAYSDASPSDTEWAYGTTDDLDNLVFDTWINTSGNNPSSMIDKNVVLHLISDDIYLDVIFKSFSGGGSAGGFSYERSTK